MAGSQPSDRVSEFAWRAYGAVSVLYLLLCAVAVVTVEVFDVYPDLGGSIDWPRFVMIAAIAGSLLLFMSIPVLLFVTNRARWLWLALGCATIPAGSLVVNSYWYDALGMAV